MSLGADRWLRAGVAVLGGWCGLGLYWLASTESRCSRVRPPYRRRGDRGTRPDPPPPHEPGRACLGPVERQRAGEQSELISPGIGR